MICDICTTKNCKLDSQFLSLEKDKLPYTFRNYFFKAVKDGKEYEQTEKDITMTTQNKFHKLILYFKVLPTYHLDKYPQHISFIEWEYRPLYMSMSLI